MKKRIKQIAWIVVLLFVGSFLLYPNLYVSPEKRAFANLFLEDWMCWEDDLFEGSFPVWQQGATTTIDLKPEYTTEYCVSLTLEVEDLPREFNYQGWLRAELLYQGNVIKVLDCAPGCAEATIGMTRATIRPFFFYLPLDDRYWDDTSLRLTVMEPDRNWERYADRMVMRVDSGFKK